VLLSSSLTDEARQLHGSGDVGGVTPSSEKYSVDAWVIVPRVSGRNQ
jgi:hypothetical protein